MFVYNDSCLYVDNDSCLCVFSDSCVFAVIAVCMFTMIVVCVFSVSFCVWKDNLLVREQWQVFVFTVISGSVFTFRRVLCVYTDKCFRVYSG